LVIVVSLSNKVNLRLLIESSHSTTHTIKSSLLLRLREILRKLWCRLKALRLRWLCSEWIRILLGHTKILLLLELIHLGLLAHASELLLLTTKCIHILLRIKPLSLRLLLLSSGKHAQLRIWLERFLLLLLLLLRHKSIISTKLIHLLTRHLLHGIYRLLLLSTNLN